MNQPFEEQGAIVEMLACEWARYWAVVPQEVRAGQAARPEFARRAAAIYGGTADVLSRHYAQRTTPLTMAVSVLRELADGYALSSYPWSQEELDALAWAPDDGVPMPYRPALEQGLEEFAVAEWARGYGFALDLQLTDFGASEELEPDDERDQLYAEGLVAGLVQALEGLDKLEDLLSSRTGRQALLEMHEAVFASACNDLVLAKKWIRFANSQLSTPAQVACGARRYVSQALFQVATAASEQSLQGFSLSYRRFIEWMLHYDGTAEWLVSEGVALPTWNL